MFKVIGIMPGPQIQPYRVAGSVTKNS